MCQVESIIEYDSWCDVRQARCRRVVVGQELAHPDRGLGVGRQFRDRPSLF